MGVNQQHSASNAATRNNITQLLRSSIEQGDASNNTSVNSDFDTSNAIDTRILRRSKRNLLAIYEGIEATILGLSASDLVSSIISPAATQKQVSGLTKLMTIRFDSTDMLVRDFNDKLTKGFKGIQDVSKQVAENYWAIDRSYDLLSGNRDLLLGNQGLLLANQGLLLVNTGLLIGVVFMLMNINSKLDRNYEAILRVEAKVDRNYEAILRVENKVDRNLEVMLSRFKILEYNLTNVIERGLRRLLIL